MMSIYSTVGHTPRKSRSPIREALTAKVSPRRSSPKAKPLMETKTASPRTSLLKRLKHRLKKREEQIQSLSLIEEPIPIASAYHTADFASNFEIQPHLEINKTQTDFLRQFSPVQPIKEIVKKQRTAQPSAIQRAMRLYLHESGSKGHSVIRAYLQKQTELVSPRKRNSRAFT